MIEYKQTMVNFKSITDFLEALGDEPKGCPTKDLEKFKSWVEECDFNTIQDNVTEGFGKAVRKLSNSDLDNGTSFIFGLLEVGLIKMVKSVWARVRNDTGKVLDIMDAICGMSETNSKAKTILAEAFSSRFLDEINWSKNQHFDMEVVKCLNILLEQCPIACREKLIQNADIKQKLHGLASKIYTAGDYEIQVGIIECLFRFVPRRHRAIYAGQLFSEPDTAQLFLGMKDNVFETDCRTFLNSFNSKLSTTNKMHRSKKYMKKRLNIVTYLQAKVYSYPCLTAQLGTQELTKPSDTSYTDFWVDFNAGFDRISLFCEQEITDSQGEESSWESVSVWKKDLRSYHLDVGKSPISLTLSLNTSLEECIPVVCAGQTASYALLTFEAKFAEPISMALGKCYGKEFDWKRTKEQTVKASRPIAPVHLKNKDPFLPQMHHDSADSEVDDRSSANSSSEKKSSRKPASQKPRSSYPKASVPAQPMRTPARLTFAEINKKAAAQQNFSNKSPFKNFDSTDSNKQTPSKTVHSPVKHSPSVREEKPKESKSKATPKTPIGKRTRSGGKVKTPLILQPSPGNVRGKQRKRHSREKESTSESENHEKTSAINEKTMDVEIHSSYEKISPRERTSISERLSIVKMALSNEDKADEVTTEMPENKLIPDVVTIPDSLPMENQSFSKENQEKNESRNDSGISVQDTSGNENDKSHSDKEQSDNPSPVHNLSVPEDVPPQESSCKETVQTEEPDDQHSGEISLESSVDCSATFPKRTLRSRSQVTTSTPISVIEDSQVASPLKSTVETEVSYKPSTKPQRKKQKKVKPPANQKAKTKGRNAKKSPKNVSELQDILYDKEMHMINTIEQYNDSFSKLKSNKLNLTFQRPNSGKKTVYNSISPHEKKKTKTFDLDPYEFDAETESNASSVHRLPKKEKDKPKLNRIFTSKNKKVECANIDVLSPVIIYDEGSLDMKPNRDKFSGSRKVSEEEKNCFGFESQSKSETPPNVLAKNIYKELQRGQNEIDNLNSIGSANSRSNYRVLNQEVNKSVLTNSRNPTKQESENYYKLLTLQKIKENVKKAGLQSPNPWSPIVPDHLSTPVEKEINSGEDEEKTKVFCQRTGKSNTGRTKARSKQKKQQKQKTSTDSSSDKKQDEETSDDNIISNFKDICKGILEDSENLRERRNRKPVTYKELSDSDVDKYETPVELNLEVDVSPITKSLLSMDDDISPTALDIRSELSWLGSQRKQKKIPVKTYKQKYNQKYNQKKSNFEAFSTEFNFKSLSTSGSTDYPTLADISRTLSEMHSTKGTTYEERNTTPAAAISREDDEEEEEGDDDDEEENADDDGDDSDQSDQDDHIKTDPVLEICSKELIVSLTPLDLTLDKYDDDDDEDEDELCITPKDKKHKTMKEFEKESSDEEVDDEMITSKLLSSRVSGKTMSRNLDISIGTPVVEDPWNADYVSLTPAVPLLSPLTEDSVQRFPAVDLKARGLVSGPSSTMRITKSAVKRKYDELEEIETEEEEDNDSDDPQEEPQNLSQNSTGSFQPRKLFRTEKKTASFERRTNSSFGETTSSQSLCSEESLLQADFGDISIQKGVSTFIQTFGLDIKNQLKEKRKRLDQLTKGATNSTQKHLSAVWAQQSENRSRLMTKLKDSMLIELIELEKDVTRLKDAEDHTVGTFKRQLSVIQTCRKSQEQRLKNLKRLHHGYGKSVEKMAVTEKLQQVSLKDNLKNELASLHQKLLRESQQQEMGKFRRNLKNLI